jgi:hypothetical protein
LDAGLTRASDRYADVMRELKTLKKLHERRGVDNPPLDSLRGDIARLTQSETENNTALAANLASLTTKLVVLDKNRELYRRQLKIVESLYFPELKRRQSDITDANRKTEKWVFDKHRTTFLDWLESGNGIYWISGLVSGITSYLTAWAFSLTVVPGWQWQIDAHEVHLPARRYQETPPNLGWPTGTSHRRLLLLEPGPHNAKVSTWADAVPTLSDVQKNARDDY